MKLAREQGGRAHSRSCETLSDAFPFPTIFIKVISTLTKVHFIKISFDGLLVIALTSTLKCSTYNGSRSDSSGPKLLQGTASELGLWHSIRHLPAEPSPSSLTATLPGLGGNPWGLTLHGISALQAALVSAAAYTLSHCKPQSSIAYGRTQEWWEDVRRVCRGSGGDRGGSERRVHRRPSPAGTWNSSRHVKAADHQGEARGL